MAAKKFKNSLAAVKNFRRKAHIISIINGDEEEFF